MIIVQSFVLLFALTYGYAHGMQMPSTRTISEQEILASFEQIKKCAKSHFHECYKKGASDDVKKAFSLTIYSIEIASENLAKIINNTKIAISAETIHTERFSITRGIEANTALLHAAPKAHAEIIELYEKGFNTFLENRTPAQTHRDLILLFFDVHKAVIRTLGLKWGFDARTVLTK